MNQSLNEATPIPLQYNGNPLAIFNPHDKPVADLPVIYGFNNGGQAGFLEAVLIAQDGSVLGTHLCSHEAFMASDLGVIDGTRPDRHETFRKHYPEGYRMEFVRHLDASSHTGLRAAIAANNATAEDEPDEE